MNRTIIGLGVALAGAGFATGSMDTSHADTSPQRFTLVAEAPTNSLLARPCDDCVEYAQPAGAHIGGTEYDSGILSRDGRVVGHFGLVAIGVSPFDGEDHPGELQLNATLVLSGGELVGQGVEEPPLQGGDLAITGGTGRYAGARGTVRYTDNPDGSTTLRVVLIG